MRPDDLDLTYNPFDDDGGNRTHNDELTDRGRQHFGSALTGSLSAQVTPALGRRRLSTSDSQAASGSVMRRRHKRSRSDLRVDLHEPEEPSPASGHPLKSAAMRTAEFLDGITRPYLSRLVQSSSINNDLFGVAESEPVSTLPRIQEPTTEVLVHEVSPSDSLAGVSLKYGIDLIELRRANQLWANDSIHLRKTLLIPLHRAINAREYIVRDSAEDNADLVNLSGDTSDANSPIPPPTPGTNVRRVPISQLSGFPPSSNSYRTTPLSGSPSTTSHTSPSTSPTKPGSLTRNNTLNNHSLSSLLNALPIAASTRDEITSRLSLDSATSSQSDRRASSEDSGHEMRNVQTSPKRPQSSRQHQSSYLLSSDSQTPRASHKPLKRLGNQSRNGSAHEEANGQASHRSQRLSASPPAAYISHAPTHDPYIRTSQMEPSPGMKLPFLRSNSDGYSGKNHKSLDVKHQPFDMASHTQQARRDRIRRTDLDIGTQIS